MADLKHTVATRGGITMPCSGSADSGWRNWDLRGQQQETSESGRKRVRLHAGQPGKADKGRHIVGYPGDSQDDDRPDK